MSDKAEDNGLGLSIRFVKEWDIKTASAFDIALMSCSVVGHTWQINVGEAFCNVCGAPNLALATANTT